MFGSILDVWATPPLGPDPPSSVRGELLFMVWVLSGTSPVIGWPFPQCLCHL